MYLKSFKKSISFVLSAILLLSYISGGAVFATDGTQSVGISGLGTSEISLFSSPATHTFDISEGPIIISQGTNNNTLKVVYGAESSPQTLDNIPTGTKITLNGSTTSNAVTVNGTGITSNISLAISNINIDLASKGDSACAFSLLNGAKVDLELVGSNNLNSGNLTAGIRVPNETGGVSQLSITAINDAQVLNVASSDKTAYGKGSGAGIGGNSDARGENLGIVIINSGTVKAHSSSGAGIGGGAGSQSIGGSGGKIEIYGGLVDVTSINGSGIGGGYGLNIGGNSANTTIAGGNIKASSDMGAGIGAGGGGSLGGISGAVIIRDGIIESKSRLGAGIGSGGSPNEGGASGSMTISGGTVNASSDVGAGIGAGAGLAGKGGTMGGTTINGGNVVARSNSGAGIGGGGGREGGNCENIQITKGYVNSVSTQSSGIGGGKGVPMGDGGDGILDGGSLYRSMLYTKTDTNFDDLGGNDLYQVSFIVKDTKGKTLPDVNVGIKGESITMPTDKNGLFSIYLPKPSTPTGNNGSDYSFVFSKAGFLDEADDCEDVTLSPETIIIMNSDAVGKPTVVADLESAPDWIVSPMTINLEYIAGENGNINWSDKRYSLSQSPDHPGGGLGVYLTPVKIVSFGEWYIHYTVRDEGYNGGAIIRGTFGPYRFGTIPIEPSNSKSITKLTINGSTGFSSREWIYVPQPYGTNITSLEPIIKHTGESISPTGPQDFTTPVVYTVTAENGTTRDYTVVVLTSPDPYKQIEKFSINGIAGDIIGTEIFLELPYGTNLTNLSPRIKITGTSVSPADNVPQDFTNPVKYTVTAADNSTVDYTAFVTVASPSPTIDPFVTSNNPIKLNLNGNNSYTMLVNMGFLSDGITNMAEYATVTISDSHVALISPMRLFDSGEVTVTGIKTGTETITVRFFSRSGEMVDFKKDITVKVLDSDDGGTDNGGGNNSGGGNSGGGKPDPVRRYSTNAEADDYLSLSCTSRPLTVSIAKKLVEDYYKNTANATKSVSINAVNYTNFQLSTMKFMTETAQKKQTEFTVNFDNVNNRTVKNRLYIKPAESTRSLKVCTNENRALKIEKLFETHFSNSLSAFSMVQTGELGQKVHMAVHSTKYTPADQIIIYTYDSQENIYRTLKNANAWVDANGYIRFDTTVGGDFIISKQPLERIAG